MDIAKLARLSALLCLGLTSGCATTVPKLQNAGETADKEIFREGNLVAHIKCELTRSLLRIELEEKDARGKLAAQGLNPDLAGYSAKWLNEWGAKANLKVQVEEATTFAPSVTIADTMSNHISIFPKDGNVTTAQAFSLPIAIAGTAKATRTETIGFYFKFAELRADAETGWKARAGDAYTEAVGETMARQQAAASCPASDGPMMEGDLKIYEFMRSKVQISRVPGVIARSTDASPFDVFNYEVQFVVTRSGSASPSWKLYPVSINQVTPLLSGSRTKTNNMILTLGKVAATGPNKAAEDAHLAALIGQSVADSLRNGPR